MNSGTLYTSYFARIKQGKGIKLSVARFNPKWLKDGDIDEWFKDLAPSVSLLNDYKNGKCNWDGYTIRYNKELRDGYLSDARVNRMIETIRSMLHNGKDVTIYCYEKSSDNCHRHLIGELFTEMLYEVKEI